MRAKRVTEDVPSPAHNCLCLIAPVVAALGGPWSYVLPMLLVGGLAGIVMLIPPSRHVRQMGLSLLIGSALSFVYLVAAVGSGW